MGQSLVLRIKNGIKSIYKALFIMASKLPVKRNTIMFESFLGKQYSCNPRAIYEYMKENHPEYKMFWSVEKGYEDAFRKHNIPFISRFSIKWLFATARAEFWVSNSRMPLWIPKPRYTTYLQTWHGTPLKKLANDMDEVYMHGITTDEYKKTFTNAVKRWDYLLSPNAYSSTIFKRAFKFNKTVIESGYPRNDILYTHNNDEEIKKIKIQNNIPLDKKVILYAPTWRDDMSSGNGEYKFDLNLDLIKMKKSLGEEYIIILRMHYLVVENFNLKEYEGFVFDFSTYEDIRELYLISDILITDYSSVFFDYANLRRPMIFYVYDIENYRDKLRGFYFDIEKAPGPIVKTTDDVIEEVLQIEKNDFLPVDDMASFYNQFCYLEDGFATKRVVENVFLERI